MHNSNELKQIIEDKLKEKSGAPSGAATPCCRAAPDVELFKKRKSLVPCMVP